MLLFINYNTYSILIFLLTIFILKVFLVKFFITTLVVDLLSRTITNYFFFTNLFIYWTNLYYLHTFFLLVIFLCVVVKSKYTNYELLASYALFLILSSNLFCEFYSNTLFSFNMQLFNEDVNSLLKNTVNKIHPLLLYSSFTAFFISVIHFPYKNLTKPLQKDKHLTQHVFSYVKFSMMLIVVALYLGSWWALQEGSWGGWWNWDSSEFFGLLVFYYLVLLVHRPDLVKSWLLLINHVLKNQYFLIIFFLLLQLNFNVISHNFGFRSTKFLNIEVILFLLLLLLLFISYSNVNSSILLTLSLVSTRLTVVKPYGVSILLFNLFNFVVALSLINFLIKVLTNLKFFVSFLSFYKLLCIVWLYFWLRFLKVSYSHILFTHLLHSSFYFVFIFIKSWRGSLLQFYLHYILFIIFTVNLVGKYYTINTFLHTNLIDTVTRSHYLALNTIEVELWLNFITNSTSFEGKSFSLCFTQNYSQQLYLLNTSYFFTVVNSLDPIAFILNLLFFLSCTLLVVCFTYPKLSLRQ